MYRADKFKGEVPDLLCAKHEVSLRLLTVLPLFLPFLLAWKRESALFATPYFPPKHTVGSSP
jgi:hypothetical protein